MCGRYVYKDGDKILKVFPQLAVKNPTALREDGPRYNAGPMQQMPVFAIREGALTVQKMKWWLVPHWSKDGKVKATTFNARAENLLKSRLYAPYFAASRCLVPASAFYEWKKVKTAGEGKAAIEKVPMCVRMKDERPFMFAGLFSVWKNAAGDEFPSFSIITTTPNPLMATIHDRMPVVLPEKHFEKWLDRDYRDTEKLGTFLKPYPAAKMEAYPVSKYVSNSRNEGPECMKPV
jgi:putative SOS response-associated peptidase YedK